MCIRDRPEIDFGTNTVGAFNELQPEFLNHVLRLRSFVTKAQRIACLLYTSDAADERSSVDLGGRRIINKKKKKKEKTKKKREKKY